MAIGLIRPMPVVSCVLKVDPLASESGKGQVAKGNLRTTNCPAAPNSLRPCYALASSRDPLHLVDATISLDVTIMLGVTIMLYVLCFRCHHKVQRVLVALTRSDNYELNGSDTCPLQMLCIVIHTSMLFV